MGTCLQFLVPSAERVRFTSSGTEATLMAVRLARAFTGRATLVRFQGHFHGWHDHMASGYTNHFDGSPTPGVLPGVADKAVLLPPNEIAALRAVLAGNRDIAAVILEPTGASFGQQPIGADFVQELRQLTEQHGVLLILDEVVTGFRAPGGAQAAFDVRPDLSSFAKIVAGGLPGAAVAGRKDILDQLDFAVSRRIGREKVQHPELQCQSCVGRCRHRGTDCDRRDRCVRTRVTHGGVAARGANEVLAEEGVPWSVYGAYSGFHTFLNPRDERPRVFDPAALTLDDLQAQSKALVNRLRLALLVHGVDVNARIGGFLSATHTMDNVAHTADAFREATRMLRQEGELPK